ncbi:hypothetical protein DM01DRAFT_1377323 [Hesseltinella vesiculosa]|uniref:Uncharacterized protein n=1 Tax=Hesseltinella vesiculosa TaxID=101127 RepID=A0A1X2G7T9_9FUNG|nr:hypothetical protein DM01DRAFT_1377323 [Hesseltinella vesiculosa]
MLKLNKMTLFQRRESTVADKKIQEQNLEQLTVAIQHIANQLDRMLQQQQKNSEWDLDFAAPSPCLHTMPDLSTCSLSSFNLASHHLPTPTTPKSAYAVHPPANACCAYTSHHHHLHHHHSHHPPTSFHSSIPAPMPDQPSIHTTTTLRTSLGMPPSTPARSLSHHVSRPPLPPQRQHDPLPSIPAPIATAPTQPPSVAHPYQQIPTAHASQPLLSYTEQYRQELLATPDALLSPPPLKKDVASRPLRRWWYQLRPKKKATIMPQMS